MMRTNIENVIIVNSKTRLQKLKKRFNTVSQAKFYLKEKGGDFEEVQQEDSNINRSLGSVQKQLSRQIKTKVINRSFLTNYIFTPKDLVVVVGQDGLVANTAKYVGGIPIIGVNPDPDRYDGVLLPFRKDNFMRQVDRVIAGHYRFKEVTMAEAKLNDGQRLLAFNDLFIGPKTHRSARYKLSFGRRKEQQSSSGIIVSTGAGSTGWFSSLMNMANGIVETFGQAQFSMRTGRKTTAISNQNMNWAWDARKLTFVVREPFLSRTSNISILAGLIEGNTKLTIESLMPQDGVIFSDGIEADFLSFTSGMVAEIGIALERAKLVLP